MDDEIERRAYADAAARGIVPGARVRITGQDPTGSGEQLNTLGTISYPRGPWEWWCYVDTWHGLGTTFDIEQLTAVSQPAREGGA